MRETCTPEQLWAHRLLDEAKAGIPTLDRDVRKALQILGDL